MKKLRIKIVIGVLASTTLVFTLTILIFSLFATFNLNNRNDSITNLIDQNGGKLPAINENIQDPFAQIRYNEESNYRMRYFYVTFTDNRVSDVNTQQIHTIDEQEAVQMALRALDSGNEVGTYEDFRYRVSKKSGRVIFLEYGYELAAVQLLIALIALIALAFIVMITVVFYFLSKRIVLPFAENAQMQKQFITDASHELKTPLAIISANAEVLAYKDGENEWINNITEQVTRISELVNELLTLNRLEEVETVADVEPVAFSDLVNHTADSFEEVFRHKNAALVRQIEPDVTLNGNPAQLERLVSVLTENASKYVTDGGEVRITVKKEGRYTLFSVFNTCETDPNADYKHLFDRFYRPDSSRTSQTGGHGIGLSIAKRICVLHNGSIEAVPAEGGLSFNVRLSNKMKGKGAAL